MTPSGNLLAWIKPSGAGAFIGAFVGEGATPDGRRHFPGRAPAIRSCSSSDEARKWVEDQATALDLPIKWIPAMPQE
jgi:hypothetical protein